MVARSVLRPLNVIAVRIGKEGRSVFDLELFKGECAEAASRGAGQQAIREIVARAVEVPGAVLDSLGEPRRAEVKTLHRSADLTILNVIWRPRLTVMPHNHNMWAVIGIYTGPCGDGDRMRPVAGSRRRVPRHSANGMPCPLAGVSSTA